MGFSTERPDATDETAENNTKIASYGLDDIADDSNSVDPNNLLSQQVLLATSSKGQARKSDIHQQTFYHNLFAGVCSGTATSIVCAPLDLLRTRMQVLGDLASASSTPRAAWAMIRHMWQTEGVAGYFRGLNATLWTVPAFWGVYCK